MFATGETVGLAKWIIDDTCLVTFLIMQNEWTLKEIALLMQEVLITISG